MRRFKYAYSALVYYGEDIGASIDRVARFGYDGIELLGQPETYDAPAVRRREPRTRALPSAQSARLSARTAISPTRTRIFAATRWPI